MIYTFVWRGAVALLLALMILYTVTITTETEEVPLCELMQTTGGTVTLPPGD